MTFSIRAIIRALAAPRHRLGCSTTLWDEGLAELARRGQGRRESGAFLLGHQRGRRRIVERFVYYDDLDPRCLDSGIVVFDGTRFGPLWACCRETGLRVVADVHTHGNDHPRQSSLDRDNPMIATPGHIALIVPDFARHPVRSTQLGIYEYRGEHRWFEHNDRNAARFFYIGRWV